jgi:hypothetical protein
MACTEKQQLANARNAKLSTGPRSVGGKDRTRYNALKHGLRCDLAVIPGEDPAHYEAELGAWLAEWGPQDVTRMRLVEKGMRSTWRLARIFRVENALYTNLALEAAEKFDKKNREDVNFANNMLKKAAPSAGGRFEESYATMDALVGHWRLLAQAASAPFGWTDVETHHKQLCRLMDCTHNFWRINPRRLEEMSDQVLIYNDLNDRYDLALPEEAWAEMRERQFAAEINHCLAACIRHRDTFIPHVTLRRAVMESAMLDGGPKADRLLKYEATADRALSSALKELKNLGPQDLAEFDQADERKQVVEPPTPPTSTLVEATPIDTNGPKVDATIIVDRPCANPLTDANGYSLAEASDYLPSGEMTAECELRLQARAVKYAEEEAYARKLAEDSPAAADCDGIIGEVISDDSPPRD